MATYSKSEYGVMTAAMHKLFGLEKEFADAPSIKQWMEQAAEVIVEYDGTLKREKKDGREKRMSMFEVYDGQISDLVSYLRSLYKDKKTLNKWELIFTVCNEILDVQKSIEQARTETVFGNTEATANSSSNEEPLTSQDASTEDFAGKMNEPISHESEEQAVSSHSAVEIQQPAESHSAEPSGNVQEKEEPPLFNNHSEKEQGGNVKMSENVNGADALLAAAQQAAGNTNADPAATQSAPTSNVVESKADDKETREATAALLNGQAEQRNAWVRNNVVTAIVSTQTPAALRTIASEGKASKEDDAAKAGEEVAKKLNSFIASVSGKTGVTLEQFEGMSDDQKYANVAKPDQIPKAKAMYELFKQIKQNPTGSYAAYIPGPDKVAVPIKGFSLGGKPITVDEFIIVCCDQGTGAVYGEGSVDANGNDVGDKPTVFKVGTAKKKEKAKAAGMAAQTKDVRVPVVRPVNKREFLADPKHIVYLFTKEDAENAGAASFKAAIQVGGELMGATVSVFKLDENGNKIQRGTDKDNNPTYKTKVASINVAVPVKKIVKEFGGEFKLDGESILVTAGRWGVQMAAPTQKGNYGNMNDISSSPIFDVFTAVYAGNLKMPESMKASKTIQTLKNASAQAAAQEASAAATELA